MNKIKEVSTLYLTCGREREREKKKEKKGKKNNEE